MISSNSKWKCHAFYWFSFCIKAIVECNQNIVQFEKPHVKLGWYKMISSGTKINVNQSQKDKFDLRLRKFEKEYENSHHVNCRENLNEYLYNSTLHGLRYVGDRTISRFERWFVWKLKLNYENKNWNCTLNFCRVFFACMFFLVVGLSIYFISIIWLKWTAAPMIISLSPRVHSVTELPFPGRIVVFFK